MTQLATMATTMLLVTEAEPTCQTPLTIGCRIFAAVVENQHHGRLYDDSQDQGGDLDRDLVALEPLDEQPVHEHADKSAHQHGDDDSPTISGRPSCWTK